MDFIHLDTSTQDLLTSTFQSCNVVQLSRIIRHKYFFDNKPRKDCIYNSNKYVDINRKDKEGQTALMNASRNSSEKDVRVLLAYGADPNIQDGRGWTALMIASRLGYGKIVRILLVTPQKSSLMICTDPNIKCKIGWDAWIIASKYGHREVASILLDV